MITHGAEVGLRDAATIQAMLRRPKPERHPILDQVSRDVVYDGGRWMAPGDLVLADMMAGRLPSSQATAYWISGAVVGSRRSSWRGASTCRSYRSICGSRVTSGGASTDGRTAHDAGLWQRSYGNQMWEFDDSGLMARRYASINDAPIGAHERRILTPARPDETPGATR